GKVESPENYELVDGFGPTEAFAFMSSIHNSEKITESSVGYLNYNTKDYVLDKQGRLVPVGAIGELCIAGYQIADGYLNREEETLNAFIRNPFDNSEGYDVMYRTGDMVCILPDGSIGLVGRRDSQVKVRGNRVELSEVEAVIREIDYIDDVTVQTIKVAENYELVAYVVSSELDDNLVRDIIQEYVGDNKPDYMVPSFVIQLDSIPLNVNGKVDRNALPEVDFDVLLEEYVAPTNETEKQIVSAFENAFNQKGIGLYDDFVRLGGDSITAIRVISLLERNGISCKAHDILSYKTPYLIAQNVEKVKKISYGPTVGNVDLLPIQSYFFDQIGLNDFTQDFVLKSKVDLDLNILQEAFDELCNVHDMLRATYKYENNEVIQEILPLNSNICEIEEYRLDDLNDMGKIIAEFHNSLDINGDLIKIGLIYCDDECYIVFVIHHLIIDGVSWSIIIDDLTYILNQMGAKQEINLVRPYPYKSWVSDVKSLADSIPKDEKQHWIEISNLLDDALIEGKSKGFTFNIESKFDANNILMLSEEEYWALSIARSYKKTYGKDIIFNRESYGRDESLADVSRTVGWFTSQFPVHVKVDNGYDNISLVNDVYDLKEAFKDINHLGLNYESMIYVLDELKYKHCPVTFNFLSTEFSFENELFEPYMGELLSSDVEFAVTDLDSISFGVSLNISRVDDSYVIRGDYPDDTYIGDKFEEFIDNIKSELEFIGNYSFDGDIVCCLSEPQLGIYLDEKAHDKGTAYSTPGIFECSNYSIEEIENAIHSLINKHPILKARVDDRGSRQLLVCDNSPSIKIRDMNSFTLIKPFNLNKALARFFISETEERKFVFYDMHHIISDATSRTIINRDLSAALSGELDDEVDLGFVYSSRDSFNSKFEKIYDESYEFFKNNLSMLDSAGILLPDGGGFNNNIKLPIHDVRSRVEVFCRECGVTVGNFMNGIFAYTLSRFTGSNHVYYAFSEHGRHELYLQDALGMYIHTLPIIVNCENRTVEDYLVSVSDLILDAMRYRTYPFRLLAYEFDLNNNVAFEYNYDLNDESGIGDELTIDEMSVNLVSDFLCVVNDIDDGYVISIESSEDYSDDLIIRFLKAFEDILMGMLDNIDLSDISYISSEDKDILNHLNQTEHELPYDDILDAFNDNLAKYPQNNLVSYNNVVYSYEEGAFIADKIANSLKDIGVKKQDNVAFLLPRSELYMLSVLGILSMGGVYVPLDDKLPAERIKFMIDDTESKVIVVSDETYSDVNDLVDDSVVLLNISEIVNGEISKLDELPV
ncbi:MAG: AMP-binding protein, partial [Methanobrevibacter sp.]|nr:AMP-binding protein [Methanobrevibacter sp.]